MTDTPSKPSGLRKHFWDFDIDNYLNPICPRNRLYMLPYPISFWFGYRTPDARPQPKLPNVGAWLSAFLGGFIGITIITHVFRNLPLLDGHHAPLIIASFGAAAILEYNTIESPLSQPRNLIVGHFLSALVSVAVTKAFERLPYERFDDLRWLAGAICVGLASLVMSATKTVHPPAGATAILAATNAEITELGWWLLPLILLASSLMCASALLINNFTRRWPSYWWTPADLSKRKNDTTRSEDIERRISSESGTERSWSEHGDMAKMTSKHIEDVDASSQSETISNGTDGQDGWNGHTIKTSDIWITADEIILPDSWQLTDSETEVLKSLQARLNREPGRSASPQVSSDLSQTFPPVSRQTTEVEPPPLVYHNLVTGS